VCWLHCSNVTVIVTAMVTVMVTAMVILIKEILLIVTAIKSDSDF
jgi:hypothetical protein